MKIKPITFLVSTILFLIIFIVTMLVLYLKFFSQPLVIKSDFNSEILDLEATSSAENNKKAVSQLINILFLGYGGGHHAGGALTDTLLVMQIFPMQEKIILFSIPRDLWVKMPFSVQENQVVDFYTKINTAFALGNNQTRYQWRPSLYQGDHGGGALAKAIVGEIIGQEVDYYLALDFNGFIKLIDLVAGKNGLKVTIPYAFTDEYYPLEGEEDNPCDFTEEEIATLSQEFSGFELEKQFTCRYEKITFQKGNHYLSAADLLKFVRSRHSGVNGGDFGRSLRQQAVIQALKDKLLSVSMIPKIPTLISQGLPLFKTDLDTEIIKNFIFTWEQGRNFEITNVILDNKNYLQDGRSYDGQYILQPQLGLDNYQAIQELVASLSAQIEE